MKSVPKHPVILFDGVCNLCNGLVQLIIKHDQKAVFSFAALQSSFGQSVLLENNMPIKELDTLLLVEQGNIYTKSTAALKICRRLRGWWRMLYILVMIPRPVRDILYDVIARNRYKWFGQKDECMLPTPDLKSRFIE